MPWSRGIDSPHRITFELARLATCQNRNATVQLETFQGIKCPSLHLTPSLIFQFLQGSGLENNLRLKVPYRRKWEKACGAPYGRKAVWTHWEDCGPDYG